MEVLSKGVLGSNARHKTKYVVKGLALKQYDGRACELLETNSGPCYLYFSDPPPNMVPLVSRDYFNGKNAVLFEGSNVTISFTPNEIADIKNCLKAGLVAGLNYSGIRHILDTLESSQ